MGRHAFEGYPCQKGRHTGRSELTRPGGYALLAHQGYTAALVIHISGISLDWAEVLFQAGMS